MSECDTVKQEKKKGRARARGPCGRKERSKKGGPLQTKYIEAT
jgi:hypothetical protein